MSSDCGDLLLSLSEAMLYPKQAHLFSFELFLVYNIVVPAFVRALVNFVRSLNDIIIAEKLG